MNKSTLVYLLSNPIGSIEYLYRRFWYIPFLKRRRGLHLRGKLILAGTPIIDVRNNAILIIGHNVLLASNNYGYHLNMHSAVKIMVDKEKAEISIGDDSQIYGACLHAYKKITVGRNCLIGANTQIMDGSGHDLSFMNVANRIYTQGDAQPVTIEDNVWIGANCIILPGVTIGKGSVIGAGSVVINDIPPFVIAAGNPAKVVKDMHEYATKQPLTEL